MIRVGMGGWTYEPWRGTFYPPGHKQARELDFAARAVTAIEINATYYRLQSAKSWADWAARVPDGFRFACKGSRYVTNRKAPGEAGESMLKFVDQGLTELGDKLGPINWQLMGTKRFDPDEIRAFLALLPKAHRGVPLAHVIEPRHESFADPAFAEIARSAGVGVVYADADDYPCFDLDTAGFRYARLQRCREEEPAGYAPAKLDAWADTARGWAEDGRDAYVFFIAGAKVRAPAAAVALIERL